MRLGGALYVRTEYNLSPGKARAAYLDARHEPDIAIGKLRYDTLPFLAYEGIHKALLGRSVVRWKCKAAIQNMIALLPDPLSDSLYYCVQRHLGGLKKMNFMGGLTDGIETWKRIINLGGVPAGGIFFEVGTGRAPVVPLSYWLMGAKSTITVDKNPYLKAELIEDCLRSVSHNKAEIQNLFGELLDKKRLEELLKIRPSSDMNSFFDLCKIRYVGPGSAVRTGLASSSVDFHTSHSVFEHIPRAELREILEEGSRLVRAGGLFVHKIDYSDHFAYSDGAISPINFLQYSDAEWDRYAGNRFMYMNRLRHDDFLSLFHASGHRVVDAESVPNPRALELLRSGNFQVDERFRNKSVEILATTEAWIASKGNSVEAARSKEGERIQ